MTLVKKKVRVYNTPFRNISIMSDFFIFDIDGCIIPNEFQNFSEIAIDSEILSPIIKKKISTLNIFPEFFDFYKHHCVHSLAVYFITGRKRKEYGEATEQQLLPLKEYKNFIIHFYPDGKQHIKKEYFDWKINMIYRILNQHRSDSNYFHIYDDFEDLIIKLRENKALNKNIHCKLIQKQSDWIEQKIAVPLYK